MPAKLMNIAIPGLVTSNNHLIKRTVPISVFLEDLKLVDIKPPFKHRDTLSKQYYRRICTFPIFPNISGHS